MRKGFALVGSMLCISGLVTAPAPYVRAQGNPPEPCSTCVLVLAPIEGHSGDTVYLSGSGWPPYKRLYLSMACPDWTKRDAFQYQNYKFQPEGPPTNGQGRFRAFPFQILTLHHFRSLSCSIYATPGGSSDNPFSPKSPPTYFILSSEQPARTQWRTPWVHMKAFPRQVRSGLFETVTVNSWPGSTADITVSYPGAPSLHQRIPMDLNGNGRTQFRVTLHSGASVTGTIQVRVSIGNKRSKPGKGGFTIVR